MRILFLFLLPALNLCAQQSWDTLRSLKTGDPIRVLEIAGTESKGRFTAVSSDSITLQTDKGEVSIERTRTRRVQVASNAHRARHAAIGAAIGLAVGALVDSTLGTYLRNESGESSGTRAVTYIAPVALFGGIGAVMPGWRTLYKK